MKFEETGLEGAVVVDLEPFRDDRGFFARVFCAREFQEHGINPTVAQCNISTNEVKGTLRGMHYQIAPATETKFIRCTRGAIWDVIVDLRPDSPTYLQHFAVELSADNRKSLFVPEMFGHGYQTLTDDTEVYYMVSEFYAPGHERGIRHDDPTLGIEWPLEVTRISEKDRSWDPFQPEDRSGS